MSTTVPPIADQYIQTVNSHQRGEFHKLFENDAVVDDNGKVVRGIDAIQEWGNREIFDANVTLELVQATRPADDRVVLRTIVDGTFDRTGLPDPVVIDHQFTIRDGAIASLSCRLAGDPAQA